MRTQARVVVIGGGIAGVSVLYHLAKAGWTDTLLIERGELTSGLTWHAAGHVPTYAGSYALMRAGNYAYRLYRELVGGARYPVSYHVTGAIWPAQVPERLEHFEYLVGLSRGLGYDLRMLSREDIGAMHPFIETHGLLGGIHDPYEGDIDPSQITQALASEARSLGASIVRFNPVTAIQRQAGGEWRVTTTEGEVRCEVVVNAAGYRGAEVAAMVGQRLPLVTLEHQYLITEDLPELGDHHQRLVLVRDPHDCFYLRQEGNGLLLGAYGHAAKPVWSDGIPADFGMELFPDATADVEHVIERAIARVPLLASAGVRSVVNGPIAYAPDAQPLVGPAEGLTNFYHCCALQVGITHGPAAGKTIAEYIVGGETEWDPFAWDPRRFGPWADTDYTTQRACELYEHQYAIPFPHRTWQRARPLQRTTLHDTLARRGAVFAQIGGWERAMWFERPGAADDGVLSFHHECWHPAVQAECEAARDAVAVMDHGGFTRYEIRGPGAAAFLDRMICTRLPAIGRVRLTYLLTPRGMIFSEATVARLAETHFVLCGATLADRRDLDWLRCHAPIDGSVEVIDGSDHDAALIIAGPRSRALLARLVATDVSAAAAPWMPVREVMIGDAPVRMLRVSYVGELSFELHLPMHHLVPVYERLRESGEDLGITDFGSYALNAMRIEKGFHGWGSEIGPEYTLLDAGLERFAVPDKGPFIGRDALVQQLAEPRRYRYVGLRVESPHTDPLPGAPILIDDSVAGYVTSASTAFRSSGCVALGYVEAHRDLRSMFHIEVLGQACRADLAPLPFYDPENRRLRA